MDDFETFRPTFAVWAQAPPYERDGEAEVIVSMDRSQQAVPKG